MMTKRPHGLRHRPKCPICHRCGKVVHGHLKHWMCRRCRSFW